MDVAEQERVLRRLRWLSTLFDDHFRLPGTRRRFGLDGILGLLPGFGDAVTSLISLYLAYEAWRLGVPPSRLARMGANVGVDFVLGSIPLAGDLFDFAWKANRKNIQLVLDHLQSEDRLRRP